MTDANRLNLITHLFNTADISHDNQGYNDNVILHFTVTNKDVLNLIIWMDNSGIAMHYKYSLSERNNLKFKNIQINETIYLYLSKLELRVRGAFSYYNSFDDFLLKNHINYKPKYFYINELSISHANAHANAQFKKYLAICSLHEIIDFIAVNVEKETSYEATYTIFNKQKIHIKSSYKYRDIKYLHHTFFSNIKSVYDEILLDKDRRTNGIFMQTAIENVLKDKKNVTFSTILKNIKNIYQEYQLHHQAYINSLDAGKLKEDYEESLRDYIGKFSGIIGDLNNKVIFIPIAFIVGIGQLTPDNFSKNLLITMGVFILAIFVSIFTTTQKKVLLAMEYDIEDKLDILDKNTYQVYHELKGKIKHLRGLVKSIKTRFIWTHFLSWGVFVIIFATMLAYKLKLTY